MIEFHGVANTEFASKYLQQLCKHFGHKVSVEFTPEKGRVVFPMGFCLMTAQDNVLTFFFTCGEEEAVPVLKSIIDKHLVKFAWREDLETQWSDGLPENMSDELKTELEAAA